MTHARLGHLAKWTCPDCFTQQRPGRFVLVRHKDVTGNSGVGIIGEGVAWTGGPAFLHWVTEYESFVHWPGGVDAILAVHGHEGSTIARWLDDEPTPPAPPVATALIDEDPLETFDREDR